ncbi:MAG: PepSY-like domain-containing protein [Paludibacteraceae bacterium]|nr:PepSY-like domain-containing protein [Paludibacteraceae bacterium]MBR4839984.1 PepSY-like domain-containing protein [Paludibacteraceae bacterium]
MKQLKLYFTMLLVALMTQTINQYAQAENVQTITADRLPAKAKKFITDNFPGKKATNATAAKNGNNINYTATLSDNDTKIVFTKMGDWNLVECTKGSVPNKVVPEKILKRSKELYKDAKVAKIAKVKAGYEVKLTMGTTLKFNQNCTLTDMIF